jgi:hypothetical protein
MLVFAVRVAILRGDSARQHASVHLLNASTIQIETQLSATVPEKAAKVFCEQILLNGAAKRRQSMAVGL